VQRAQDDSRLKQLLPNRARLILEARVLHRAAPQAVLILGTHGKRGVIGVVWLVAVAMHVGREM